MNEIKIKPNLGTSVSINNKVVSNGPKKESEIRVYSWNEALNKKLISNTTIRNVENVFGILGIKPNKVYFERTKDISTPSVYIRANYHGEELLYARKASSMATGVTKLYSKYTNVNVSNILQHLSYKRREPMGKIQLLQALKIPTDLAEIMIQPNNQATIDKFEDREESAPVIAPSKPGTKEKNPPKRRRVGNPQVDPKPKASLKETEEDDILKKIVQRFNSIRHEEAA